MSSLALNPSSSPAEKFVGMFGQLPGLRGKQLAQDLKTGLTLQDVLTVYADANRTDQYPGQGNAYLFLRAINEPEIQKLLSFIPIIYVTGKHFTKIWETWRLALYGEIAPGGPVREIVYERQQAQWTLASKGLQVPYHIDTELDREEGFPRVKAAIDALAGSAAITYWNDVTNAAVLYPYMDSAFVGSNESGPRVVNFAKRFDFMTGDFAALNYDNATATQLISNLAKAIKGDPTNPTDQRKALLVSEGTRSQFNAVDPAKEQLAQLRPSPDGNGVVVVRNTGVYADYELGGVSVIELAPPQVGLNEELSAPLISETVIGRWFPEQIPGLGSDTDHGNGHAVGKACHVGIYRPSVMDDKIVVLTKDHAIGALRLFGADGETSPFYTDLAAKMTAKYGATGFSRYPERPADAFWLLGYNPEQKFFVPETIGQFHESVLSNDMIEKMVQHLLDIGAAKGLEPQAIAARFIGASAAAAGPTYKYRLGRVVPAEGGKSKIVADEGHFTEAHLGKDEYMPLESSARNRWKQVKNITRAEQLVSARPELAARLDAASQARLSARIKEVGANFAGNAGAQGVLEKLLNAPNNAATHKALARADLAVFRTLWFSSNDRFATESIVAVTRGAIQYPMSVQRTLTGRSPNGKTVVRSDMMAIAAPVNPNGIRVASNVRLTAVRGGNNAKIVKERGQLLSKEAHAPSLLPIPVPVTEDHSYPMALASNLPSDMSVFKVNNADPVEHRHSSGLYATSFLGPQANMFSGTIRHHNQFRSPTSRTDVGSRGGVYYYSPQTGGYTNYVRGNGPLADQRCNTLGAYLTYNGKKPHFPDADHMVKGFKVH